MRRTEAVSGRRGRRVRRRPGVGASRAATPAAGRRAPRCRLRVRASAGRHADGARPAGRGQRHGEREAAPVHGRRRQRGHAVREQGAAQVDRLAGRAAQRELGEGAHPAAMRATPASAATDAGQLVPRDALAQHDEGEQHGHDGIHGAEHGHEAQVPLGGGQGEQAVGGGVEDADGDEVGHGRARHAHARPQHQEEDAKNVADDMRPPSIAHSGSCCAVAS